MVVPPPQGPTDGHLASGPPCLAGPLGDVVVHLLCLLVDPYNLGYVVMRSYRSWNIVVLMSNIFSCRIPVDFDSPSLSGCAVDDTPGTI